jgi:hypothetical protein
MISKRTMTTMTLGCTRTLFPLPLTPARRNMSTTALYSEGGLYGRIDH